MVKKSFLFLILLSVFSCGKSLSLEEKQEFTKKGKEITQDSFKELSGKLMDQMSIGGPAQAIPFCNIQAIPITNQLSEKYNVLIKRTSDKIRNLTNHPTKREIEIISTYKNLLKKGKLLTSIVELDSDGLKHYYAPIVINSTCLVCHGKKGEQLTVKTDSIINSFYPNDNAIGYHEGDVRGIWSITFNN
ncbi:MAG: hypothetical protein COB01_09785 [Lutibacter sp.]|nr:MAG: hypothetical protein COB01_09785 [Lutibacter sp.]